MNPEPVEVRKVTIYPSNYEYLAEIQGAEADDEAEGLPDAFDFVSLPPDLEKELGSPDELEMRILRNEKGQIVSIILNKLSE